MWMIGSLKMTGTSLIYFAAAATAATNASALTKSPIPTTPLGGFGQDVALGRTLSNPKYLCLIRTTNNPEPPPQTII